MPRHDDLCDDDFCGGYTGGGYAGTSDIFEAIETISHTGGQDRPTGTNPGPFIRANHQEETGFDQELIDHSEKIVDLVIVMDCTGSMGSEIEIAKKTVTVIMTTLHEHFQTDLRFAAISYRDHTDSFAVKEYPFTKDVEKAKSYIQEFSAEGGGDHPEALCSALKVLSEMPFNKKGKKLVVWIGDAPPHGMKSGSDSYPEGCKDEQGNVIDWVKLGSALQEKNVIFYTIICERAKDDQQLTLFMDYLATKTDGKCLLLTDAKKVPNLIINGCIEDDEMEKLIAKKIEELGEQTKNMKIDDLMQQVHEMTSKEKVAQVQTYVVASTKTKDLMKYTSMSDYDDNDMYCNASNNVTKDGCENEFDDFSYGEVNYYAPTKEKVTKAFLRNTRK